MTTPQVPPGGYNCEQVWQLLFEYLDGGLDDLKRDRVEAHLRLCFHCSSAAELSDKVHWLVGEWAWEESPAGFGERLAVLLRDDETPEVDDLPGTFPPPEDETERVKRLSRFSTRKREHPPSNADVSDDEASQARGEMGFPLLAGPPEPIIVPSTLTDPATIPAVKTKANVTTFYVAGIGATIILAILMILLARPIPGARDGNQQGYIETLLASDVPPGLMLPNGSVGSAEQALAQDPAVTWPIVLPEFDDTYASYRSVAVIDAGGYPVATARFELDSRMCSINLSEWGTGNAPPGEKTLQLLEVEGKYRFRVARDTNRTLVLWTEQIRSKTVLYALLIAGGNLDDKTIEEVAMETRLEVLHRINTQTGTLPGP